MLTVELRRWINLVLASPLSCPFRSFCTIIDLVPIFSFFSGSHLLLFPHVRYIVFVIVVSAFCWVSLVVRHLFWLGLVCYISLSVIALHLLLLRLGWFGCCWVAVPLLSFFVVGLVSFLGGKGGLGCINHCCHLVSPLMTLILFVLHLFFSSFFIILELLTQLLS
ncbi:hypothetical protein BJ508DRAFT_9971 [Ascobolus immersus RN42]|uniref:Uncharacterized protein n=1 Tax=Ascobolus immersus RN42 TaxID=1160509 RepID=A0A3N4HR40_ASCIM|nr:hypothetical protein BJ508DRAFT_9971 [Ascobolus immersus RN42]